jgi:hypothetical protein
MFNQLSQRDTSRRHRHGGGFPAAALAHVLSCCVLLVCGASGVASQQEELQSTQSQISESVKDKLAEQKSSEKPLTQSSSTVGIEAVYLLRAGRGDLQAASTVDSKVVLRIANVSRDQDNQYWLELRYIGMFPGRYDLRDYVRLPNGEGLSEQERALLQPAMVDVKSVLPPDHDGKLTEVAQPALPWVWPYRKLLVTACLAWFILPIAWWLVQRRNAKPMIEQPAVIAPSLADRLKPLVTAAMEGRASVQSQAELERLLLTFWRGRLNLVSTSAEENLLQLKCHPEAGKLLGELEIWLYHPPGNNQVDLQRLLAPYAEVPS